MGAAFLQALRACLGDSNVLVDGDLDAYQVDWRKRYRGRALAVARPSCTDEVAAVVRLCATHGVPVVPQGGNTGLSGGATPGEAGDAVVVSLARLNRVRRIDAANNTIEVEAGVTLQQVQDAAREAGRLFPLSLAAQGTCTIGGNLATNAGGVQVLRYGNARELCLGLEVATPQGELWNGLRGLRKDNTGYDLRDLYIGSEGTLGVITAATLKLFPLPAASLVALAACPDIDGVLGLLRIARKRLDAGLTGFELIERFAMGLVARHLPQLRQPLPGAPWTALLELSAECEGVAGQRLEGVLAEASEQGLLSDAVVSASAAQASELWQLRESIPSAQASEGLNIKHDIGLPVSAIPGFLREVLASLQVEVPGLRPVLFGHLGDGNLHFNLQAPEGMAPDAFLHQYEARLNALVYDAVLARGGTFSAEHGIGALKVAELAARKSPVALAMMRAVKRALDPQCLLNPGRLLAMQ
jgi:FAD/FMN-containing dehydrogenase